MVFRQVGSDTDKLISKFGLLNKSFANIKTDMINGHGLRSFVNIVSQKDIDNFAKFNQELNRGTSYHKAFNNYLSKSHTYVQQQALAIWELNEQNYLLACQRRTGQITEEQYKTALATNNAQIQKITTSTQKLTLAQKASAVASKVMGEAMKMALNIGVIVTINLIISLIDKLVNRQEAAAEKAAELRQENEEEVQASKEELNTINDLISQYEKFKDVTVRIAEDKETLKSIQDQLIETFGSEVKGIDLVNGKYEEQIELLKEKQRIKAQANIDALTVNKDYAKEDFENSKKNTFKYYDGMDSDFYNNSDYIATVKELINNIPEFKDSIGYSGWSPAGATVGSAKIILSEDLNSQEKVRVIQDALDFMMNKGQTDNELFKHFVSLQAHYQTEVDAYNKSITDLAQGYIDAFKPLADDATVRELDEWKKELLATIDDEEVKKAASDLINTLYYDTALENSRGTILNLDSISEETKTVLSEYSEQISDFISEKEKIDSALKEQDENGSISQKTAMDLIQDDYKNAVEFDAETNSFKLLREEIDKTAKSRREETKTKLESGKVKVIQQINDELEAWRKSTGRSKDDVMYQHKLSESKTAIQEINKSYNLYISMLETANTETSEFTESIEAENEALEKATENIENINNAKSAVEKAIEEQNEFGRLSADTIKALHEAGLGAALAFNEATGETTLMTDSVYDLIDAMIEAEKNAAEIRLNNLKNDLAEINQELNNMTINGNFDKEKFIEGNQAKQEKEKQVAQEEMNLQILGSESYDFTSVEDSEQAVEDAHEEYINSIKEAFEREKSDIDYYLDMDLISQEEYYNRLAKLNEKYFKGKEDFLDEYRQYEVEVYQGLKKIREEQEEQFEEEKEEQINLIKEAFDKEKSDLDHLLAMEAITQEDYYNKLYDLNKQYFKDKEDFLDEYRQYEEEIYKGLRDVQIQAIQEQIDALKSVNEEKQEEIDLEKAKQALENAKKQRTIRVYDSERGWIHETDREAIDTAQKEYDDLVLNEKIEVLENLIKSIEEGRNTKHSLDEKVDVLTQVSGSADITEIFPNLPDEFKQTLKNMQNSIASGIGASEMFAQQNYNSIPNNSNYEVNNKLSLQLNNVTVMANNPEEFISQMEQIANQSFNNNFPVAMGKFGEGLARYRMNHS